MIISGGGEEIPRLALKLCNWINRIYGERKMRAKMRIHLGGGGGIYIRQLLMFKKMVDFFFVGSCCINFTHILIFYH